MTENKRENYRQHTGNEEEKSLKIVLWLQRVQLLHFIYVSHLIQLQCFSSPAAALFGRCIPVFVRVYFPETFTLTKH